MNAPLPTLPATRRELPARVGNRVLVRATKHDVDWRCESTVTGKVCNRTGTSKISSWTNATRSKACKPCTVYEQRHIRGDTGRDPTAATGVLAEYFQCKALSLRCTRRTCAKMHALFNYASGEHAGGACTKCAIGAAHAAKVPQAHPDAPAIAQPVAVVVMAPQRLCLSPSCRAPLPVGRASHCDKTCQADAIRAGVFAGMQSVSLITAARR